MMMGVQSESSAVPAIISGNAEQGQDKGKQAKGQGFSIRFVQKQVRGLRGRKQAAL